MDGWMDGDQAVLFLRPALVGNYRKKGETSSENLQGSLFTFSVVFDDQSNWFPADLCLFQLQPYSLCACTGFL